MPRTKPPMIEYGQIFFTNEQLTLELLFVMLSTLILTEARRFAFLNETPQCQPEA